MASAIYVCLCHGAPISETPPSHFCTSECGAGIHYDHCEPCKRKMLAFWKEQKQPTPAEEGGDDGA